MMARNERPRSVALVHLGNIACRHGRTLMFDPVAEAVIDDSEANAEIRRRYRADHWAVPAGV
jgi:hypothetical protein